MNDGTAMKDLVSVMMPVYNGGPYLNKSISSVLSQTYHNFELIVLDDASSDDSLSIIRSFNDDRIRLECNQQNQGLAYGRTRCLQLARGKYCAWLDQDDWSEPHRLEAQVRHLEANPDIDVLGSSIQIFGFINRKENVDTNSDIIHASIPFENPFANSTLMFRASVFDRIDAQFYEEFYPCEDYELYSRLLQKARAANLPGILTHYRTHAGQSTQSSDRLMAAHGRVQKKILKCFLGEFSEVEFAAHQILTAGQRITEAGQREECNNWIGRLLEANKETQHFPLRAFERVLDQRWFGTFHANGDNTYPLARTYWKGIATGAKGVSGYKRLYNFFRLLWGPHLARFKNTVKNIRSPLEQS